MIYYLIRHIATQEFMPQLERGRGYSHWNPAVIETGKVFRPRKLLGVPRLLPSRGIAAKCIAAWNANPNSYTGFRESGFGIEDVEIKAKDDGRKKEDLEVVEVVILDRVEFTKGFHQMIEDINEQG